LLEHQHRVVAGSRIDDERGQAGGSPFPLVLVATAGVIDRRRDAADSDRGSDRAFARVTLVLHVQPSLSRQHEAAQHPACRVEITRHDGAGDE